MVQTTLLAKWPPHEVVVAQCKCSRPSVKVYHSKDAETGTPIVVIHCVTCKGFQSGITREEVIGRWNMLQLIT